MLRFLPFQPTASMLKTAAVLAFGVLYLAAEVVAWVALVPHALSVQAFAWISVLALTATVAAGATLMGARATRTVAHVLYDVEHPARLPKA